MKGFSDAAAPCLAFYFFTNDVWAPSPYVRPIGASDGDYRQASSPTGFWAASDPDHLGQAGIFKRASDPKMMGKLCRFLEPLTYTMGKLILKKPRRPKPHHRLALHATFPLPAISVISSPPAVIPLSTTSSLAILATSPCKAPQSSSTEHSTHHHHLPPLPSLSGGGMMSATPP